MQDRVRVFNIVFKQDSGAFTEIFVFADFSNMFLPYISQAVYVSDSAHQAYLG